MNAQPELTRGEKVAAGAAILRTMIGALVVGALCGGCKSFYDNAGVSARMGSVTAPIEISEPTSSVKARALYAMDGIDFYAAKGCIASMEYENVYTNNYFGVVIRKGRQRGKIKIEPCETCATSEADASKDE